MVIQRRGGEGVEDWQSGSESGPPVALVKGEGKNPDQMALVSISHDGQYATAVCMGFDPAVVGGG